MVQRLARWRIHLGDHGQPPRLGLEKAESLLANKQTESISFRRGFDDLSQFFSVLDNCILHFKRDHIFISSKLFYFCKNDL
jgi:hypothetical protein